MEKKKKKTCKVCRGNKCLWKCSKCAKNVVDIQCHLNYDHHMKLIRTLPAWLEKNPFLKVPCTKCQKFD